MGGGCGGAGHNQPGEEAAANARHRAVPGGIGSGWKVENDRQPGEMDRASLELG